MSEEHVTNQQPLIRYVNRQQMSWRAVDIERLVSEDHPARAIWTLIGRLDFICHNSMRRMVLVPKLLSRVR